MKSRACTYYESAGQIIIGVVLEDGRRFSIDLKVRPQYAELMQTDGSGEQGFEVLASGEVMGRTVN